MFVDLAANFNALAFKKTDAHRCHVLCLMVSSGMHRAEAGRQSLEEDIEMILYRGSFHQLHWMIGANVSNIFKAGFLWGFYGTIAMKTIRVTLYILFTVAQYD